MTIAEIIEKLEQEKSYGSRFPARMVFVDDLSQYMALVSKLKNVCDVTINIADFGKDDVAPRFDKLKEQLATYEDKHILVLSVGEYLRLCTKRELQRERSQFPMLWESLQAGSSKTRFVIPVFYARDLFDRVIGTVDERQERYIWSVDLPEDSVRNNYGLSVYSPQFAGAITASTENLEVWLRTWDALLDKNTHCSITTSQYKNVEPSFETVNLKIIDNPFAYLSEIVTDADKLQKEWATDKFWAELIPVVVKGSKFEKTAFHILNVNGFDFVSLAARWEMLNSTERWIVWVWYRMYPSEQYYSFACKKAGDAGEIPAKIRDEILMLSSRSAAWINERMGAVKAFRFTSFDDEYSKLFDALPLPETKLQLLTYQTHEECAYAVKVISGLLRNGAEITALADIIRADYPNFATYMNEATGLGAEIDDYFAWYRKNKLINRFPGDYPGELDFDKYDTRYKALNTLKGKECFTLWLDGFGLEWLPVLLYELARLGIQADSKQIVTAILPTEIEYNHQWTDDKNVNDKWDRLDILSHKGMPDDKSYFSCIVYQLSVFYDAAQKVKALLDEHEYVIVTGDHGSSRLAALAFHDENIYPVTPPQNAIVHSFGRFCELGCSSYELNLLPCMYESKLDGKSYIVMLNYQHFTQKGNVAGGNSDVEDVIGEIHGGNTPEERLVPIVVVRRKQPLPPLTCKPASKYVTKKNGQVEVNLTFNRHVSSLVVTAGNSEAICKPVGADMWHIVFSEVVEEQLLLEVVANGNLLAGKIEIKIKGRGIDKSNDTLG